MAEETLNGVTSYGGSSDDSSTPVVNAPQDSDVYWLTTKGDCKHTDPYHSQRINTNSHTNISKNKCSMILKSLKL